MKNDPTQILTIVGCVILLVASIVDVSRVIVTQQALNQECNSNYSFIQVALAGNNLSRICQIKNQTITIK
jgi:sensor domain CHASE-containing protein